MSWMPTPRRSGAHVDRRKDAILANVHRGLLLASASRRLQDSISSQRASAEARLLLSAARQLCDEAPDPDRDDERVRMAIESLTRALDD